MSGAGPKCWLVGDECVVGRLAPLPRWAAWYPKPAAVFAGALARLRQYWFERIVTSAASTDMTEPISPAIQRVVNVGSATPASLGVLNQNRRLWNRHDDDR